MVSLSGLLYYISKCWSVQALISVPRSSIMCSPSAITAATIALNALWMAMIPSAYLQFWPPPPGPRPCICNILSLHLDIHRGAQIQHFRNRSLDLSLQLPSIPIQLLATWHVTWLWTGIVFLGIRVPDRIAAGTMSKNIVTDSSLTPAFSSSASGVLVTCMLHGHNLMLFHLFHLLTSYCWSSCFHYSHNPFSQWEVGPLKVKPNHVTLLLQSFQWSPVAHRIKPVFLVQACRTPLSSMTSCATVPTLTNWVLAHRFPLTAGICQAQFLMRACSYCPSSWNALPLGPKVNSKCACGLQKSILLLPFQL